MWRVILKCLILISPLSLCELRGNGEFWISSWFYSMWNYYIIHPIELLKLELFIGSFIDIISFRIIGLIIVIVVFILLNSESQSPNHNQWCEYWSLSDSGEFFMFYWILSSFSIRFDILLLSQPLSSIQIAFITIIIIIIHIRFHPIIIVFIISIVQLFRVLLLFSFWSYYLAIGLLSANS